MSFSLFCKKGDVGGRVLDVIIVIPPHRPLPPSCCFTSLLDLLRENTAAFTWCSYTLTFGGLTESRNELGRLHQHIHTWTRNRKPTGHRKLINGHLEKVVSRDLINPSFHWTRSQHMYWLKKQTPRNKFYAEIGGKSLARFWTKKGFGRQTVLDKERTGLENCSE